MPKNTFKYIYVPHLLSIWSQITINFLKIFIVTIYAIQFDMISNLSKAVGSKWNHPS